MQTHNLKELKKLNKSELKASFRPGQDPNISIYQPADEPERIMDLIWRRYLNALQWNRKRINDSLRPVYGRPLQFSDKSVSEMLCRVKNAVNEGEASFRQMAERIRTSIEDPTCTFFRFEHGKQVPIASANIVEAYKACLEKKSAEHIKTILYGSRNDSPRL
jgi:hypothetical protein